MASCFRSGDRTTLKSHQSTLFEDTSATECQSQSNPLSKKTIQRSGTGLFGKAMLKEAIQILPHLPDTESLDEIRAFLRTNLHFSAEQTRQRNASYVIRRMFPHGYADAPLRKFAECFPGSVELGEVCFYRFVHAEPLVLTIMEDLIRPNIASGVLSRRMLREYLSRKHPDSRSINDCAQAAVEALSAGSLVRTGREKIAFAYRDIPVASFAFILHSEFPEPGMYDIRKVEESRILRAMLWNPERLLPALYELRNRGLISKVSEIDTVRQFTTKYTLGETVDQLTAGEPRA